MRAYTLEGNNVDGAGQAWVGEGGGVGWWVGCEDGMAGVGEMGGGRWEVQIAEIGVRFGVWILERMGEGGAWIGLRSCHHGGIMNGLRGKCYL